MVRSARLAAVLLLAACADDPPPSPPEPAPLADVCGAPGPFHLLPLAEDERVGTAPDSFAVSGDRMVFLTGTGVDFVSPAYGPIPMHNTVRSVGPCGEDPVVIGHDIEEVFTHPEWPDVVFGCTLDGLDLVLLDPSGVHGTLPLADEACFSVFTAHGLLRHDDDDAHKLSARFYPMLDPTVPLFGAPVLVAPHVPVVNSANGVVRLLPDEVLMVEEDHDLVSIALPDLGVTGEQSGVLVFAVSGDARWLQYQTLPSHGDDEYNPIGVIHLRDRETGVTNPIGSGQLTLGYPYFFADEFALVQLSEPDRHQVLISLPDLESFDIPPGHTVVARIDDGRWLTNDDRRLYHLLDLTTGKTTRLTSEFGRPLAWSGDQLDFLLSESFSAAMIGPLLRIPYDSPGSPRQLARRANRDAAFQSDGRVVTLVDIDDDWLGELLVVDPDTQQESSIDDHVVAATDLDRWHLPGDPDTIVYGVVDGDRTGVWLTRPAPRD